MQRQEVYDVVNKEREFQIEKWGVEKEHSVSGYLLIMKTELDEAIAGWINNRSEPRQSSLEEILQVVATGIVCLETYGTKGNGNAS